MRYFERRPGVAQTFSAFLVVGVFVAGFVLGNINAITQAQAEYRQPPETEEDFAAFWQTYQLIREVYVDPNGVPLETETLVNGAIDGMVNSLGDQFSGYMDPETFPVINLELEGEFEGIGVVIRTVEETGEIVVVSVLEGSPAQAGGIAQGDVFSSVDDVEVMGMNQVDLANVVRGPEGTPVKIIMRRGEELVEFNLVRARIIVPNVESEVLENNIGYIRLNQFSSQARTDLDTALEGLNPDELDGLILDLRGNPGGLLSSAVSIGSAFIEDGTLLVEDFGDGNEEILTTNGSYNGFDRPLVVLVDEGSASASELIAGALQDNERATIIGETTFGKGTVQTWQQLENGGGVRLTIARWLTPDRNWIHDQGIVPDIMVDWDPTGIPAPDEVDPQLEEAIEFLSEQIVEPAS